MRLNLKLTHLLFLLALTLAGAAPQILHANPNLIVGVEKAKHPLSIDGDLDDWTRVRWIPVALAAPHSDGTLLNDGITEPPGTAGTAADLSGEFALQWDDAWIYLAARVYDNVRDIDGGASEQWWVKDSVSLYLDVPLDGDGYPYIPGDHVFSFVADTTYPDHGRWWRRGEPSGHQEGPAPPETQLAVRPGEWGDYTLEAAIPMSALTRFTPDWQPPFANRKLGFHFFMTDPDGGPDVFGGQVGYGEAWGHWKIRDDDANWSTLHLLPGRTVSAAEPVVRGTVTYRHDGSPWSRGTIRAEDPEGHLLAETTTGTTSPRRMVWRTIPCCLSSKTTRDICGSEPCSVG